MTPNTHGHLRLHLDRPLSGREQRDLERIAGDCIGISPVGRTIDIRPATGQTRTQPPANIVNFLITHDIGFTPNNIVSLRAA